MIIHVTVSSEARAAARHRMLTQNPKVKIGLSEGQKRALARKRASHRDWYCPTCGQPLP